MRTLIFAFLMAFALAFTVSAQTGERPLKANPDDTPTKSATPKPKKAAPPAVELTAEQEAERQRLFDKAVLAETVADSTMTRIERDRLLYPQQTQAAATAKSAYQKFLADTAIKLGIPREDLPNYVFDNSGGTMIVRRKSAAKGEVPLDQPEDKPPAAKPEPKTDGKQ
jgi:hypothetical protein